MKMKKLIRLIQVQSKDTLVKDAKISQMKIQILTLERQNKKIMNKNKCLILLIIKKEKEKLKACYKPKQGTQLFIERQVKIRTKKVQSSSNLTLRRELSQSIPALWVILMDITYGFLSLLILIEVEEFMFLEIYQLCINLSKNTAWVKMRRVGRRKISSLSKKRRNFLLIKNPHKKI